MNKLYLDFDGCITSSVEKICEMYNEDFKDHPKFKPAKWWEVNKWDMKDECPLANSELIESYFCEERFFTNLKFMDNAKKVIELLTEQFEITVVTLGYKNNLDLKEKWLKENLPCIHKHILLNFNEHNNKIKVDMSGTTFIDDNSNYLKHSNAEFKICFGDIYSWNESWEGVRCHNWYDVGRLLLL